MADFVTDFVADCVTDFGIFLSFKSVGKSFGGTYASGKVKWPFYELLVAMVTHEGCTVGKLLPRLYLSFWHTANIWKVFLKLS